MVNRRSQQLEFGNSFYFFTNRTLRRADAASASFLLVQIERVLSYLVDIYLTCKR